MSLSIVITTYNRRAVLKQLLESLADQSDLDFHVVVAIDGSTDDTEAMLSELAVPFPLKWVNTYCDGYGLAVARNLGILAAETELVAIIDDDCFPWPGYVAAHKQSARRRTITGGPRTPASSADVGQAAKMRELGRLPDCAPLEFSRLHRDWPLAVTTECNICMFREDLIELGLFSERLKIYGFIGQEFFARARHFGFLYQYNHAAGITHHRQPVGDNDLSKWRRRSQIMVARALGPGLMNQGQYAEQARWATRMSEGFPSLCAPPPIPASAWITFPYRFLRNRVGDFRRRLKRARSAT